MKISCSLIFFLILDKNFRARERAKRQLSASKTGLARTSNGEQQAHVWAYIARDWNVLAHPTNSYQSWSTEIQVRKGDLVDPHKRSFFFEYIQKPCSSFFFIFIFLFFYFLNTITAWLYIKRQDPPPLIWGFGHFWLFLHLGIEEVESIFCENFINIFKGKVGQMCHRGSWSLA